ncbi:error-prone DNA polymerase [Pseudomonas sp. PA1(2017)]|uniref:error-prone DNA polymerase n=1 Tax=Pseudomonas sp. PA1(2017) TaxID=1932113 RepID=UPI0009602966|nr:error-prone DNA polymerase [Pseudomonas sp. PA1(2017)]OLU16678.1 error-prone DNA polymerase [Pseudomonas sp. PA1(2017)]
MNTSIRPPAQYAELHCLSNFSFQRGASSAKELFEKAGQLGYEALAITDECSLAGIVRAWQAAKESGVRLITGTEIRLAEGPKLVLLAQNLAGYQRICALITAGRRRSPKGQYELSQADLDGDNHGVVAIWIPGANREVEQGQWLAERFSGRSWIGVELHKDADDDQKLTNLISLGEALQLPVVATGDVHMHVRGRRALQDTMTAIRHHCIVAEAGRHLFQNGERHLRPISGLADLYPADLLAESVRIASLCTFDLSQLKYEYPHEVVPVGKTPAAWLRELTYEGAAWRWPDGMSPKAQTQIEAELGLIEELQYESYFLTVHDIVRFARSQNILCQGRGSAANSAVCFALGITELDPTRMAMLFERFISKERNEPPDIDVDFEHERREEVIQYIFNRYGRERAALTAVASTYHFAGAIRDVAKALGWQPDQVTALANCCGRWSDQMPPDQRLQEAGFDPQNKQVRMVLILTEQLVGFPRHLSQHPGGFVISEHPLSTLVPVENAAMKDRTIIQWDKDDIDALGLMKVDVLALGMLSAIRRCLDLLRRYDRRDLTLATIPPEDAATYRMISKADTLGVFQIESRAQMSMLPRLKPKTFYDLVIEVAIVRPGPIVGDMVHPYLRRRNGEEEVTYPSEELRDVFERTLGVPLFQEQVMRLAIVAAGYSPGEADQLRRSMAAWKRHGGLEPHQIRLRQGMLERGYSEGFAARIFEQIKGFGSYGFPESHAASFALLTYASCWLKCHEQSAYACALINSWPMGFYSPDQVLQDARRHGVEIRPVDVTVSDWDCTLEALDRRLPALRMGLRMIRGLAETVGRRIQVEREAKAFGDVGDLCLRAGLDHKARELLAEADALKNLAGHRHAARWEIAAVQQPLPLFSQEPDEKPVTIPEPSVVENMHADYARTGTTLGPHPMSLLRAQLKKMRAKSSQDLREMGDCNHVTVIGIVTGRQRPSTASGVTFVTLEDEFGMTNVIVWKDLAEQYRSALVHSKLLQVKGKLEDQEGVVHLIAGHLADRSDLLEGLDVRSRNFH